jgi:glycosyltransferase involved in cell wall biosynthesis
VDGPAVSARGTVILVTDRMLHPVREGSRARIVQLIHALRGAGYRVTVISRRVPGRLGGLLPAVRPLAQLRRLADRVVSVRGDFFHHGDPTAFDAGAYRDALARHVAREKPAAVIAEYLWMAPCLEVVPPSVVRAVDTHDVMHRRAEMYRDQPEGAWGECSRDAEIDLLSHADVVMAIQPGEQALLREMLPGRTVLHVPHGYTAERSAPRAGEDGPPTVAFVGSRIQGNLVGMTEFIEGAWPLIRTRHPDARLRVFGDIVTRLAADAPGVEKVGWVEDLGSVYADATVIVNPVRLGTGLKIKTVEALAHGRALVTTTCGADGLSEGAGSAFLVADRMEEAAAAVVRLLDDRSYREAIEAAALELAERRFSPRAAIAELVAEIDRVSTG